MPYLKTAFTLKEVHDSNVERIIVDHQSRGGSLNTQVFCISNTTLEESVNEYESHLVVARLTLEKANFEMNSRYDKAALPNQRKVYPFAQTDFDRLDPSGVKICFEEFIGFHNSDWPVIPGQLTDSNIYFAKYTDNNKGGFMQALLGPPYPMSFKESSKEAHTQDFLNVFFGNLDSLIIYAWDTHCSPVFDAGNEWWGSYFWTIYSPTKDWFIGLIASETD